MLFELQLAAVQDFEALPELPSQAKLASASASGCRFGWLVGDPLDIETLENELAMILKYLTLSNVANIL